MVVYQQIIQQSIAVISDCFISTNAFSALPLLIGWQEGIGPVISWVLVCWQWCS